MRELKPIENTEKSSFNKIEKQRFKEIKPHTSSNVSDVRSYFDKQQQEMHDKEKGFFTSYKDRFNKTPTTEKGIWTGERAESKFIPDSKTEGGKNIAEILKKYKLDGIEYRSAEPDFSKCSEMTLEIDRMTADRNRNFPQADVKCATVWSNEAKDGKTDWTRFDVKDWRRNHKYSWHERCDMKTMDLVPTDINSYFTHYGGCAECRIRDKKGGEFDE